jgi:nucleotide-binding universal stress UspA family protein
MSGPQGFSGRGILFADDGEPASDVAWAWLTAHQWGGWRLQTVTARWASIADGVELKPSRFVPRRPPEEAGLASWEHVEVEGDPRVVLLGRAGVSLLVVGCHHRGHLAGLWAGSTTEWLVVHPPAPMLLACHGNPTRSVAFCVDGSPHAQWALQAFWALPWARRVSVNLVSVDDGRTDVERSLRVAGASLPAGITPAQVRRLAGPSRRELVGFIRAKQVDLVVMGTRGLSGVTRMRVGSTVSALLKDGSANLLIAHMPDQGRAGAR